MYKFDFAEISKIPFKQVLDNLCIPYTENKTEYRGGFDNKKFVVSKDKNMFIGIEGNKAKGSVINFYADILGLGLKESAEQLFETFLSNHERVREIPNLKLLYCNFLEAYGITKETAELYNVGMAKYRGVFNGYICFKCNDYNGLLTGYVGYLPENKDWKFPKDFKRTLYNFDTSYDSAIVCCNPFDCLLLIQLGFLNTVCLIGSSMTENQEEALKHYKHLLLFHPKPANIILRLMPYCYIKAPILVEPLRNYSADNVRAML